MSDSRRSISVKGETYQRLKDYCASIGQSVSGYVEDLVTEKLDAAGAPQAGPLEPRKPREAKEEAPEEIVSQHFTF